MIGFALEKPLSLTSGVFFEAEHTSSNSESRADMGTFCPDPRLTIKMPVVLAPTGRLEALASGTTALQRLAQPAPLRVFQKNRILMRSSVNWFCTSWN